MSQQNLYLHSKICTLLWKEVGMGDKALFVLEPFQTGHENEQAEPQACDWRTANKKCTVFPSSDNRVARLVTATCKTYG